LCIFGPAAITQGITYEHEVGMLKKDWLINVAVQVARGEIFDKLEPKPQKIRIILITVYR
jgi:hypothetical protein